MQFISFDAGYLERLAAGDPAVEEHFNEYFGELMKQQIGREAEPEEESAAPAEQRGV